MTSLGRHTRPVCNLGHSRDLFRIKWCGWMMLTSIQCVFIDFWWCEGSGASFECLRMRHRSRRKCAPMNAGDLGSRLAVCACAYDPNHVTAQDKRLGPNCACVPFVTRLYAVCSLKLCELCGSNTCVCVFFFPWGHVNIHAQIWGFVTSMRSHGLNARFWLVEHYLCCARIG